MTDHTSFALTRRTLLAATALGLAAPRAFAQGAADVKIGLLVPLSGLYARPGAVMRMGAEMGVDHINSAGGVKALGGAKLKLVVIDCGDTTEKAKNAAQRMVAQQPAMAMAGGGSSARPASSFTPEPVPFSRPPARPLGRSELSDLDIPTFIRRQMD